MIRALVRPSTGWLLLAALLGSGSALAGPGHPPPPSIALHEELGALRSAAVKLERSLGQLSGDYRTLREMEERLADMTARIDRLLATTPAQLPRSVPPPSPGPDYPGDYQGGAGRLREDRLSEIVARMEKAASASEKLEILDLATRSAPLRVAQADRLLRLFTFDDERMKGLRLLAPGITDPENAYRLADLFRFEEQRREAVRLVEGR